LGAFEHYRNESDLSGYISQDWYVSTSGSNTDGVGNPGNPFASLQYATYYALYDDTVRVEAGTYDENIVVKDKPVSLKSMNGADQTIIDGGGSRVFDHANCGPDAVYLDGFTIQNGLADNGAGISLYNSGAKINNCVIITNTATGGKGGGIWAVVDDSTQTYYLTIDNSEISGNSSTTHSGGVRAYNMTVNITDTEISGNSSAHAAGMFVSGGLSTLSMADCIISGNQADVSGAGLAISDATGSIARTLFTGNQANLNSAGVEAEGGGLALWTNAAISVDNCTFAENSAEFGGGLSVTNQSVATVTNSIFWNNAPDQLALYLYNQTGTIDISYSLAQGGVDSVYVAADAGASILTWGAGNIDADPLFVDAADGDYKLQLLSPCVDAGNPADTFDPDGSRRDMGALPLFKIYVSGTVDSDIEVTSDSTIIIDDDLTISVNGSLIISPGATLYMFSGVTLTIEGILDALGQPGAPIQFVTLQPGEVFNGIVLILNSGSRVVPEYSYLVISDVADGSVPLTVNGDAVFNHLTIAGNDTEVSSLEANGSVALNYSILESGVSGTGTVTEKQSFVNAGLVHFADSDFNLEPNSAAIDVGIDEAGTNIDPDFTYSDAGAYYHDQSAYPVDAITVVYPANGTVIDVSADTSATDGLEVWAQALNEYDRYKTNANLNWNPSLSEGSFISATTNTSDLEGLISNTYITNSVAGELNDFQVVSGTVSGVSGDFRIIPGVPDSVALQAAVNVDTAMTQMDTVVFMVDVFDQFGNPVSTGAAVNWTVVAVTGNDASFSFVVSTTNTTNNVATAQLITDPAIALVGDQVRIQAESNGKSVLSKLIEIIPDEVFLLSLSDEFTQSELEINADLHRIDLTTTLIDTFGNSLEGVAVNWQLTTTSSPDGILSNNMTVTDANGEAGVTLTTGTASGYEYQVATWVTEPALFAALRNLSGAERSAAIPEASVNLALPAAYSDLNDTTAVIKIVPGAPTTITADQTDTVYVVQGQSDTLGIEVYDQFGNLVSDGSSVIWNPTPTSEYSIDEQETVTTDGKAELELTANSDAPWLAQIDFGIQVESIFDGNFANHHYTYIVEDTIPPAAVISAVIDPAVWTSTNSFDLVWSNPTEHSGVAGAHYDVDQTASYYV
ncbi:MAG: hypothetical protein KAK01_12125, partial [Candidatus Marinimicrobia bacterium]|nr:hypothetical protein [Candidatus Neomarinimicrobiota bacterium]